MSGQYSHYSDWYDNGPGSERFKREVRQSSSSYQRLQEEYRKVILGDLQKRGTKIINERKKRMMKIKKDEDFITDDDLLI